MPLFRVEWSIDLEADSPRAAAQAAHDTMTSPDHTATCFDVREFDGTGEATFIDLLDEEQMEKDDG